MFTVKIILICDSIDIHLNSVEIWFNPWNVELVMN